MWVKLEPTAPSASKDIKLHPVTCIKMICSMYFISKATCDGKPWRWGASEPPGGTPGDAAPDHHGTVRMFPEDCERIAAQNKNNRWADRLKKLVIALLNVLIYHIDLFFPAGPVCNTTWDGWLCWDETEAGQTEQSCPDYFKDFDPHGK